MVRPRAPQPVLNPSQSCCLGRSLSTPHSSTTTRVGAVLRHFRGDRFPRSAQEPEPGSRHLHAGHHPGSKQVIPWARPEVRIRPRFRCRLNHFDTSSVVHSRSSSWLTPDPINAGPFAATLTTPARHLTGAACGGLQPPPAGRLRRAKPPSPAQHHNQQQRPSTSPTSCVRGALSPGYQLVAKRGDNVPRCLYSVRDMPGRAAVATLTVGERGPSGQGPHAGWRRHDADSRYGRVGAASEVFAVPVCVVA